MSSLGRSSAVIAGGIMASRITGLIRNIVLVAAIGQVGGGSDAFSAANQLPNNIYTIISTGVLTAVIVPQIVQWSRRDDGGDGHISKLFTIATVVLLITTAVAMVLAGPLITLYAANLPPEAHALAVAMAYWCLPQILFYGLFALLGETLNARGVYGPFAWAPIVNNVVSIAGFIVFIVAFGAERSDAVEWQNPDGSWNIAMIAVLGGAATIGIVAQTIMLAIFWRRTGLSLRLDFSWRGIGLRGVAKLAGWTFLMVVIGQLVAMVQGFAVSRASGEASITVWQNTWLVFMLPYSVIVLSLGTPYFTRLSQFAAAADHERVRQEIPSAIRLLGLLCIGATAVLLAAAVPAVGLFSGQPSVAQAAAPVLMGFAWGLVPLAVLFVIQRTFYAYGDTRTPFFFTLFQGAIAAIGALVALALLEAPEYLGGLTAAVAVWQSFASLAQVALAQWLLRRRIGSFGMGAATAALVRFAIAAVPATLAGWGVYLLSGATEGWMVAGRTGAILGCLTIAAVVGVVYVAILAAFRTPELLAATAMVRRRLGR